MIEYRRHLRDRAMRGQQTAEGHRAESCRIDKVDAAAARRDATANHLVVAVHTEQSAAERASVVLGAYARRMAARL